MQFARPQVPEPALGFLLARSAFEGGCRGGVLRAPWAARFLPALGVVRVADLARLPESRCLGGWVVPSGVGVGVAERCPADGVGALPGGRESSWCLVGVGDAAAASGREDGEGEAVGVGVRFGRCLAWVVRVGVCVGAPVCVGDEDGWLSEVDDVGDGAG